MKQLYLFFIASILSSGTFAQAPEKISYQAVVRDVSNNLVASSTVGMQISILQGGPSGTPVYVETHTPTSNVNGLISVEIGGGSVVTGVFSDIPWRSDTFFLKTETDPTGGATYSITGTTQLISVVYSLYSKESGNSKNSNTLIYTGSGF